MYNPQELQRKAQLNIHGVDTNAQTSLNNNNPPKQESEQNWFVTILNYLTPLSHQNKELTLLKLARLFLAWVESLAWGLIWLL